MTVEQANKLVAIEYDLCFLAGAAEELVENITAVGLGTAGETACSTLREIAGRAMAELSRLAEPIREHLAEPIE